MVHTEEEIMFKLCAVNGPYRRNQIRIKLFKVVYFFCNTMNIPSILLKKLFVLFKLFIRRPHPCILLCYINEFFFCFLCNAKYK